MVTPGVKEMPSGQEEPLAAADATRYQALVSRANYLAMDRCDIQYAVKELLRSMANPTDIDGYSLAAFRKVRKIPRRQA